MPRTTAIDPDPLLHVESSRIFTAADLFAATDGDWRPSMQGGVLLEGESPAAGIEGGPEEVKSVDRTARWILHSVDGQRLSISPSLFKAIQSDGGGVIVDSALRCDSSTDGGSLRYHLLHPDYLYFRIREFQKSFKLRVVLCHVDVVDVVKPLLEVTRTALLHDCTLLCGWSMLFSLEECGRYLETIKMYENKPADIIQGYMDPDYMSRLNHALTTIRCVNKTDVVTLGSTFGSLAGIMDASMEDFDRCPDIGERKTLAQHLGYGYVVLIINALRYLKLQKGHGAKDNPEHSVTTAANYVILEKMDDHDDSA